MSNWDSNKQQVVTRPDRPYPEYPGWTLVDCCCCNGLEWGGDSPRECSHCLDGWFAKHEASGVRALYPGGPFCGGW